MASLLVGYSPTLGDEPSSRLSTGQIGRNERHRIYVHDHLAPTPCTSRRRLLTALVGGASGQVPMNTGELPDRNRL